MERRQDCDQEADREPTARLALSPQIVTIITTEHYALQSAQAQDVADLNGRADLFIGAVSAALIALALVAQVSHLGTAFYVFSLILFPSLVFMGIVTFERVVQSTYAVIVYARGIGRIRHLYLESAPQLRPYFILSSHDDTRSVVRGVGIRITWWQFFVTPPAMIAVITSVLIGSFAGVLLAAFAQPLWVCAGGGAAAFAASVFLLQLRHRRQFGRIERSIPPLFPGERQPDEPSHRPTHAT